MKRSSTTTPLLRCTIAPKAFLPYCSLFFLFESTRLHPQHARIREVTGSPSPESTSETTPGCTSPYFSWSISSRPRFPSSSSTDPGAMKMPADQRQLTHMLPENHQKHLRPQGLTIQLHLCWLESDCLLDREAACASATGFTMASP